MARAGLVLFGVLLTLAVLEGGYRAYKIVRYGFVDYIDLAVAGYFAAHPVYGYALAKNFSSEQVPGHIRRSVYGVNYSMTTKFTTNSLGYHGPEFSPAKPAGVFRIVTFGGSTTQGLEVDDGLNWPAQLEALLNADEDFVKREGARRVEVINAAVGGWRSLENMLRLRDEVSRFAPDVLLLAFNWNDSWKGLNGLTPDAITSIERPVWSHVKILEYLKIRYETYGVRDDSAIRRRTAGLRADAPGPGRCDATSRR
jgi:hypothetical protein